MFDQFVAGPIGHHRGVSDALEQLEGVGAPLQLDDDHRALLIEGQHVDAVVDEVRRVDLLAEQQQILAQFREELVRRAADQLLQAGTFEVPGVR